MPEFIEIRPNLILLNFNAVACQSRKILRITAHAKIHQIFKYLYLYLMKKSPPYPFVLDLLTGIPLHFKSFFGGYGVYVEDKIVLMLYDKDKAGGDKGVWIAMEKEHHEEIRKIAPSLRSIGVLSSGVTSWQVIPENGDHFESEVASICELIRNNDPRIGRIPKKKKPRKKKI